MPREEIFLTSKLWNTHHPNVKEGLQKTLDALGVDYLDLYVSFRRAVSTRPGLIMCTPAHPLARQTRTCKFKAPWLSSYLRNLILTACTE